MQERSLSACRRHQHSVTPVKEKTPQRKNIHELLYQEAFKPKKIYLPSEENETPSK